MKILILKRWRERGVVELLCHMSDNDKELTKRRLDIFSQLFREEMLSAYELGILCKEYFRAVVFNRCSAEPRGSAVHFWGFRESK